MSKVIFLQARVTKEEKKRVIQYTLDHDTTLQEFLKETIMTIVELNIPPSEALDAIRSLKNMPGE